ncbi:MAG: hypothetical protein REI94_04990 [Moraxellaceae bacterium]|nr:hypothetical protein [Moraxellaceae bacterium]
MNTRPRKIPLIQHSCIALGLVVLTACSGNDASQPFMVPDRDSLLSPLGSASGGSGGQRDLLTTSSACAASMLKAYAEGMRSLTVEPPDQSGPMAWPETQPVAHRGCDREPSPAQVFTAAPAERV